MNESGDDAAREEDSGESGRPGGAERHDDTGRVPSAEAATKPPLASKPSAAREHRRTVALIPGSQLGHYIIVDQLGQGGMGEVYRARDTRLQRDVALKVLADLGRGHAASTERHGRFAREAKLLAALNHPNVATIHGIDEADGLSFLTLELVPGASLAERLREDSGRSLPLAEALEVGERILDGLAAAHERGIVHRDLKPANVMLTDDGGVKLLDFGLAKLVAGDEPQSGASEESFATEAGRIFGTPHYMSPEQLDGLEADPRSDLWSFGCVLFEMLSGERAFPGRQLTAVLAHIATRPADLTRLPSEVPANVAELIAACLRRDPSERPADASTARAILAAARTPRQPPPLRAWILGALAASAVFLLIGRGRAAESPDRITLSSQDLDLGAQHAPQLSPDGEHALVHAQDGWRITELATGRSSTIPRTADATHAFWSPDGAAVGFARGDGLFRVDRASGAERRLVTLGQTWLPHGGAVWLADGSIVYTSGRENEALLRLPLDAASVGSVEVFAAPGLRPGTRHFHRPTALLLDEDEREDDDPPSVLVPLHRIGDRVDTLAVASPTRLDVLWESTDFEIEAACAWDADTLLVSVRNGQGEHSVRRLWRARATQARDGREDGRESLPIPRSSDAAIGSNDEAAVDGLTLVAVDVRLADAVPGHGWLAIDHPAPVCELVRVDAQGVEREVLYRGSDLRAPSLDPERQKLVLRTAGTDGDELWLLDLRHGTRRPLGLVNAGAGRSSGEEFAWTPGGTQLLFADEGMLYVRSIRDASVQRLLPGEAPSFVAGNGPGLCLREDDLWTLTLDGTGARPRRIQATPEVELRPRLAPGGRLAAFLVDGANGSHTNGSMTTGNTNEELWVLAIASNERRKVASASDDPIGALRWSASGEDLFFASGSRLRRVRVAAAGVPTLALPGLGAETVTTAFASLDPVEVRTEVAYAFERGFDVLENGDLLCVRVLRGLESEPALTWRRELAAVEDPVATLVDDEGH